MLLYGAGECVEMACALVAGKRRPFDESRCRGLHRPVDIFLAAVSDFRDLLADAGGEAALLFTCTGRGQALFPYPHHDAGIVSQHLDGGPVAGMFCAGEIGPVGGRPFVHAMSASALLFDDAG